MESRKFSSVQEVFDLYVPSRGAAENLGGETLKQSGWINIQKNHI